ncbi:MAG: hypothetical protein COV74_04960 [Candidatus Omnitrophica bacterium CG11_big_fil_rev_8_21_14_0_20_45_26]|uniref:Uncharacterized protein n=1 Tax=Candidatus Abzuiibacterium crystallinum TaxID=1974748 RepID=A0A2H0LPS0_9BACT|nr:MAG: hypothetical protein COV74_04960 [Candidatus Omnitrophica bacterium CG11_big_fil_rev_8_21_14_0_20_45_26]PIW63611.1 MAG: hypothetical protein COW12_09875 [Candidatus Omnitrophica bacterium CG12_big_fil_rev_8_21_14_0_65_45_16]
MTSCAEAVISEPFAKNPAQKNFLTREKPIGTRHAKKSLYHQREPAPPPTRDGHPLWKDP